MSENTNIEWCDSTFNPFIGCTKVSPGCDNCYAEKLMDHRMHKVVWGAGQERVRTSAANWRKPLAWNAAADAFMAAHGRRQRVFCASLADVFDNEVDPQWRRDLFDLIELTPNLDWLLLTKRIGNVARMVADARSHDWLAGQRNVMLGATIVNQAEADRDIPKLLAVPAARRFLSMEPLLGPVNLTAIPMSGGGHHEFDPIITANVLRRAKAYPPLPSLDWVIVGGESGPGARPMSPDWARNLRDQCAAAGVPFLCKQWGEWAPATDHGDTVSVEGVAPFTDRPQWHKFSDGQLMARIGKRAAGRRLDGIEHNGFPEAV